MKNLINAMFALLAISIFTIAVSSTTGWNPLVVGGVATATTFITTKSVGLAYAGLNKEIWLPDLMEGFYGDDSFLTEARDMSMFVDNDIINLAEAGVNPDVLINNTTYPIDTAQRVDGALTLSLDTYDTENTLIRSIETAELSYDKRASVLYGHKQALKMKFMQKAIHAYAPAANGAFTPVIATSGLADGGFKALTFNDILDLENKFDEAEIPSEGRILVLNAKHKTQLRKEDLKLYKEVFGNEASFAGFKIYTLATKRMPIYNKTGGTKVAFGAAAAPSTDTICSVAFQKDEVMRAQGTIDMFAELKSPTQRGDVYGFQMRAVALPIRGKAIGAIYSVASA